MSQNAIAQPIDCAQSCVPAGTSSTPGPQGPPGADGTNGTNGIDAFTLTANGAGVMPAEGDVVTLDTTTSTSFLAVGQIVYVATWGYLQVTALPTDTSVTLQNLEDTGTGAYAENAAPGTTLSASQKISPAGIQGPSGAALDPTLFFQVANNLNEGDPATMRGNLALGTAAVKDTGVTNGKLAPNDGNLTTNEAVFGTATGIGTRDAATARALLGLTLGTADTDIPPVDAGGGLIAGDIIVATASGVATATDAAIRTQLGLDTELTGYGLLGSLISQSTAATGDFAITPTVSKYRIDKIVFSNPNIALGSAQFAAYTGAGGTGTTIALPQSIAGLATASNFIDLVLEAVCDTDYFTGLFYIRCTTSQALGTCDVHVFGWDLS